LLAEAREELNRADQKASLLLTALGVAIGAVVGGIFAAGWSPAKLNPDWVWCGWSGAIGLATAVASLLGAVYPRISRPETGSNGPKLFYFEQAVSFDNAEQLRAAIQVGAADADLAVAAELMHVSRIACTKYKWLRRGIWAASASLTLCAVAVIAPH
jgi:hypothetical protein